MLIRRSLLGRATRRLVTALAIPAVTLGLVAVVGPPAASALPLAPEPVKAGTRIADRAYPGIQLVVNVYSADIVVPIPTVSQRALNALSKRLARQVLFGVISGSEKSLVAAFVNEVAKKPLTFLKPTRATRTTAAEVGGLGTGWVITPDGYMVTAAHVVKFSDGDLRTSMAQAGLDQFADDDVADLASGAGYQFTASQRKKLVTAIATFNIRYLKLKNIKQDLNVRFGLAESEGGKTGTLKPAELVQVGKAFPGKDYALLKVNGQTNMPTIPVGNDSTVVPGTTFYVAGFTGASTFFPGASEDAKNQPAVTEGPVTAVKSNDAGVPYFQTQAPAGPGNSGGPVLNDKGEAVGILVAGSVDGGQIVQGQQWVLPISVVKEGLTTKNITPAESTTTRIYNEALESYYLAHYSLALPKFTQVAQLDPGHPYATAFVSKSQTAITAGDDESPGEVPVAALAGGAGALAVAGGVGGFLLMKRRRANQPVLATAAHGAYPAVGGPAPHVPGYSQPGAPTYPPVGVAGPQQTGSQGQPQPSGQPYPPPQGYPHPAPGDPGPPAAPADEPGSEGRPHQG